MISLPATVGSFAYQPIDKPPIINQYDTQFAYEPSFMVKKHEQVGMGRVTDILREVAQNIARGEKHVPQIMPNGSVEIANFTGPGTKLGPRLRGPRRRKRPKTLTDKTAKAHDLDYALARDRRDIRAADKRMVSKLKQIQSKKGDHPINIQVAMKGIQGKIIGEDIKLLPKGSFAKFRKLSAADKKLFLAERKKLTMQGFGPEPAATLRKKVLSQVTKAIKEGGLTPKTVIKLMVERILPHIIAKVRKGMGLGLAGSGYTKAQQLSIAKGLTKALKGSGLLATLGTITSLVSLGGIFATKVLPFIIKLIRGGKDMDKFKVGKGLFLAGQGQMFRQPKLMKKKFRSLMKSLASTIGQGLKTLLMQGRGLKEKLADFWKRFGGPFAKKFIDLIVKFGPIVLREGPKFITEVGIPLAKAIFK